MHARKFIPSVLVLFITTATGCSIGPMMKVGAGYKAKNLASAVFISGRDAEAVIEDDLGFSPLGLVRTKIDYEESSVTGSAFGIVRTKAIYRPGLGVTLVNDLSEKEIRAQAPGYDGDDRPDYTNEPWPLGDASPEKPLPPEVDAEKLAAAMDAEFGEPNPDWVRGTRGVVVVYKGEIIAERYADGFDLYTPLTSWSMTKSMTSAMVGVLVKQGKIDIHAPASVPEWQGEGDPRAAITLDQLLRMSSGLEFSEAYFDYTSDVTEMLFRRGDAAKLVAVKPLAHPPDTHWSYSSGTTNLIQRIIREAVDGDLEDYLNFPRKEIWHKIGMTHSTMEPDASGTFVGSSFFFVTPRDWARFGLLYSDDGVWQGERILPEGWVEYSVTPTPPAPQGQYGAQWWLNAGEPDDPSDRPWPDLPTDAFAAQGFESQRCVVIPSRDLVVVRMGQSRPEKASSLNDFVRDLLAAIEMPQ